MDEMMYVFNPENDMALANNTAYYKAPKEILRMAADLSLLPVWFAAPGALVKVSDYDLNASFLKKYELEGICLPVKLDTAFQDVEYRPWGWSRALIHRLETENVSVSHLPLPDEMNLLRSLSGRQTCVPVLQTFANMDSVCGIASVCSSLQQVKDIISQYGNSIVKAPWSGSGRGLMKVSSGILDANLEGWIARVIRTQGEVMVEPLYNKVVDFAMEFHAGGCTVEFCGYSIFETDDQGNYKCNLLDSDTLLEKKLSEYVPIHLLHDVRSQLLSVFNRIVSPYYNGYFGVDMMICIDNGTYVVHPCVEINLRLNMGVVARVVYDRYVAAHAHGKYVVEHFFSDGEAMAFALKMRADFPQRIERGKFLSGYFPLTPVCLTTRFHIYLLII